MDSATGELIAWGAGRVFDWDSERLSLELSLGQTGQMPEIRDSSASGKACGVDLHCRDKGIG